LLYKNTGKNFGGEAGAAHAEEEDVREAFGLDFGSKVGEVGGFGGHVLGAIQPAEPVGDFGGAAGPNGMVVRPDAGGDVVLDKISKGSFDLGLVMGEGRSEGGHGGGIGDWVLGIGEGWGYSIIQ